ncbi:MAG: SH3 domain-containing protein [Paracoccaceae bacterium]
MKHFRTMVAAVLIGGIGLLGGAQAEQATVTRGSETNLPLPRYVSLKKDKANARRGPSLSHRIDWVYQRKFMPLRVVAEFEHWRRVEDRDGSGGWVHYSLLSGNRTVLIDRDLVVMHRRPVTDSPQIAKLELGVVADLGACTPKWCEIDIPGYSGWVPKYALWGVSPEEIRK